MFNSLNLLLSLKKGGILEFFFGVFDFFSRVFRLIFDQIIRGVVLFVCLLRFE